MAQKPTEDETTWPGIITPPAAGASPPAAPETAQDYPGLIASSAPPPSPSYSLLGVPLGVGPGNVEALRQGASAAVHGLAQVPGLLYDAAAAPQNLLADVTGQDWLRAAPAREHVEKGLAAVGLPPEPTPTLAHRIIENTAATLPTLAVGPVAAAIADATPAISAASPTAGNAARATAAVLQPAGEALSQAPVAQLAGGVGAGVGQDIAEQSGTTNPVVQAAGPLLGALTGAGLTEGVTQAARALLDPSELPTRMALTALTARSSDPAQTVKTLLDYTPAWEGASPGASLLDASGQPLLSLDTAGKPVSATLTPAETAALLDPAQVAKANPDATMESLRSTAEVLKDPGAFGLENDLRNLDRSQAGAFMQNAAKRQDARVGVLDQIAPTGGPDASAVSDVLGQQQSQATAFDQALVQSQQQALDQARAAMGPAGTVENTGPALQAAFDRLKAESGANVGALGAAVDPNGTTAIPTRSIKDAINAAADREYGLDPTLRPQGVSDMLARLAGGPTATFDELQNMRSAALRQSQGWGQSADPSLGRVRAAAASAIHDAIVAAGESGDGFTPDQLDAWNQFRQAAQIHGARFGEDVGAKLSQSTYGRPDTGQATVPGQYFAPGPTGADRMGEFINTFTDPATGQLDPAAKAAMQQHVAGQVGTLFDPATGAPKSADLSKFIGESNYGPALRVAANGGFPELRQGVSSVDAATQAVADTGAQVAQNAADYQKSVAAKWLGADPQQAIQTVLSGRDRVQKMGQLVAQTQGSPDATAGLKRAYLDELGRQSLLPTPMGVGDARGASQAGAQNFWDANQDAAKVLFSPDEMTRIQAVNDNLASQVAYRAWPGTGSMTAANQSNLALLKNALMGQAPGALKTAATEAAFDLPLVGKMIEGIAHVSLQRGIGQLYQLALDPEAAAMALRQQSPDTLARLAGRMAPAPGPPTALGTLGQAAAGVSRLVPSPATVAAYASSRAPGAIAVQSSQAQGGGRPPLVIDVNTWPPAGLARRPR